jgi:hypothetical protein
MMDTLAFLDLLNPAFEPTGPEVRTARAAGACARTPFGVAVLRHRQMSALLGDRRLAQGSHRLLAAQGITEGPLADWMNRLILTVDGADHTRLRRLALPFAPKFGQSSWRVTGSSSTSNSPMSEPPTSKTHRPLKRDGRGAVDRVHSDRGQPALGDRRWCDAGDQVWCRPEAEGDLDSLVAGCGDVAVGLSRLSISPCGPRWTYWCRVTPDGVHGERGGPAQGDGGGRGRR